MDLQTMLEIAEKRGIEQGINIMKRKILLAYENGTPINIKGRAYFIKSDLENLLDIFADLETDTE